MAEESDDKCINVTEDGPYQVSAGVPLVRARIVVNDAGESVAYEETSTLSPEGSYALCRCGKSGAKPYCDGSHLDINFDGTETAPHDSFIEQAASIEGPGIVLHDARKLCAEARFCDRAGGLWNLVSRCDDPEVRALAEEEAALCPSGRYVACDAETGETKEPAYEPSVAVLDDPHMGVSGPLWVRGRIPVISADGTPREVRNRVTLCRCGQSANKPFCDGSHISAKFTDSDGD